MSNSKFLSLYTLSLPFALAISIPLAFFAVITTILASSILAVRVFFVYLELAFAVISQYLLPDATTHTRLPLGHSSHSVALSNSHSPATPPITRRSRRLSNGPLTPAASTVSLPVPRSIGPARDFEGVGGWRFDAPSEDEQAWTNINSRLELPAESPRLHHRRSLTSGNYTGERIGGSDGPDLVMGGGGGGGGGNWTPNTKRLRTPTLTMGGAGAVDSYFAIGGNGNGGNGNGNGNGNGGSPKSATRAPSAAGSVSTTSGSPVSSKSSGLTMKGRQ